MKLFHTVTTVYGSGVRHTYNFRTSKEAQAFRQAAQDMPEVTAVRSDCDHLLTSREAMRELRADINRRSEALPVVNAETGE